MIKSILSLWPMSLLLLVAVIAGFCLKGKSLFVALFTLGFIAMMLTRYFERRQERRLKVGYIPSLDER